MFALTFTRVLALGLLLCIITLLILWIGQTKHIRCIYGISGMEITKYSVIYGVYIYSSGQPYLEE